MKFEEALDLLKEGKKVRRRVWECPDTYLAFSDNDLKLKLVDANGEFQEIYYHLSKDDILANDWKEYPLNPIALTDEEKEYLKMIIKFYPKFTPSKIKSVHLVRCSGGYGYIGFNASADYGVYYVSEKFFKSLQTFEEYTLAELGLDEV